MKEIYCKTMKIYAASRLSLTSYACQSIPTHWNILGTLWDLYPSYFVLAGTRLHWRIVSHTLLYPLNQPYPSHC